MMKRALSNHLFQDIIKQQLKQLRGNSGELHRRYSAEAVHDCRVAALRASFALKFLSRPEQHFKVRAIRGQLKASRGIMGDARNLDILWSHARASQEPDMVSLIAPHRKKAHHALTRTLESEEYSHLLKELDGISRHRGKGLETVIKGPLKKIITDLLDYRKGKVNGKNLHKVRAAFKKLRYACEFLEDADKPRMEKTLKYIKKFQDLLGDRQDSIVCVEILSRLDGGGTEKFARTEEHHIKDCQKEFKKLWRKSFLKSSKIDKLYLWARRYP